MPNDPVPVASGKETTPSVADLQRRICELAKQVRWQSRFTIIWIFLLTVGRDLPKQYAWWPFVLIPGIMIVILACVVWKEARKPIGSFRQDTNHG